MSLSFALNLLVSLFSLMLSLSARAHNQLASVCKTYPAFAFMMIYSTSMTALYPLRAAVPATYQIQGEWFAFIPRYVSLYGLWLSSWNCSVPVLL